MDLEADYVIVGAGSAGCVLANRLTADGSAKVLLLEAGGDDRPWKEPGQVLSNLRIHLPAGFTRLLGDRKITWPYTSEPDPGTNGRRHAIPRGRVLGGTSSINGMIYVRGLAEDYDGWRELGCAGWAWSDVEPYFRRQEDVRADGGLDVSDPPIAHPMLDRMVDAFVEAGAPLRTDLNAQSGEGVTRIRLNTRNGVRRSSAASYLRPALRRRNLRVVTRALATRVVFDGRRAVGVEFHQGGETRVATARREVILSGGAINSPQLLELSGVGQAGRLRALGIEVVADSPGVGENLQDHFCAALRARLTPGSPSFNRLSRGLGLAGEAVRYAIRRRGLLAVGGSSLTAFLRSDPALNLPDLQFFASPATVDLVARIKRGVVALEPEPGMTIGGYIMRPRSHGSVHIRSADAREHPAITPNFLAEPQDQRAIVGMLKWTRKVIRQSPLAPHVAHELAPGPEIEGDEALLAYARATGSTGFHQAGACAMGPKGTAVLDPQLQVNGVAGLRVVDASVMPRIVSGNPHAPTVMIAERASDLILAAARERL